MKQETKIIYESPIHVEIGDIFYRIEVGAVCTFREPCKVCGGTKKVTVNDVTFDYPVCRSGNNSPENISVHNYIVHKYRLSEITYRMVSTDNWKDDCSRKTKFKFYHKDGLGYNGNYFYFDKDEWDLSHRLNLDYSGVDDKDNYNFYIDAIYSDYKLACGIVARLNNKEKQRLDDYNKSYGSNYTCEFKYKNDTKN